VVYWIEGYAQSGEKVESVRIDKNDNLEVKYARQ